jgi:sugar phosphate isomerase/epimerase
MRLVSHPDFHLTYCTNIHPADGWQAVLSSLRAHAPALRRRFAPSAPFGVGLRLSAHDAAGLLADDNLKAFRRLLDDEGLYVAVINGFPYGPFHGTPVKASVYAPDWRDPARVSYTLDLVRILRALVPDGVDGGISTAPLSYKPWMAAAGSEAWETMIRHVVRVAEALARVRQETGTLIHLDIEPEPDCTIENTDETLDFFERRLLPRGVPMLARALNVSESAARDTLLDHIQVCFDCCHFAVEFEDAATALQRLRHAGVKIGRVQLSSALDVQVPADPRQARAVIDRLRPFADTTYLHQVVERRDGALRHYLDLPDVLDRPDAGPEDRRWRIHFHVPLFTADYGALASTQGYVAETLRHVLGTDGTTHLEIETYTWDVLPGGLKMDLLESIGREYEWVLQTCAALPRVERSGAKGPRE